MPDTSLGRDLHQPHPLGLGVSATPIPAPKRGRPKKDVTASIPSTASPSSDETDPHLATTSKNTAELVKLQRRRQMHIRRTQLLNLPIQAAIRNFTGYNTFDKTPARAVNLKRSQKIWKFLSGEKIKLTDPEDIKIAEMLEIDARDTALWIDEIAKRRDGVEDDMIRMVANAPAAKWVESVPGFSLKALAIIYAEARADIETFHSISRLWSRLGWGVDKGGSVPLAQIKCSKRRKAEVYACVTEQIFTAQSAEYFCRCEECGEMVKGRMFKRHIKKEHLLDDKAYCKKHGIKKLAEHRTDIIFKAAGPYRRFYDAARAKLNADNNAGKFAERAAWMLSNSSRKPKPGAESFDDDVNDDDDIMDEDAGPSKASSNLWDDGKLSAGHLHKRALRLMTKQVLLDLWRVSKGLEPQTV